MRLFELLFIAMYIAMANEPNNIQTTIYEVGTKADTSGIETPQDLKSTTYSDGMGRSIQTKIRLTSGKDRVVSTFYDAAGKVEYATKPYIDTVFADRFVTHSFSQLNSAGGLLQRAYAAFDGPDTGDDPVAYSRIRYYNDPLGKEREIGAEGEAFTVDSHCVRIWYLGAGYCGPAWNPFLSKTVLNNPSSYFDSLYYDQLSSSTDYSHLLKITRDPNGNIKQELFDVHGPLIETRMDTDPADTSSNEEIISEYEYDILDRVIVERAPKNGATKLIDSTEYEYNALGQLVKRISADGCEIRYKYNKAGNVINTTYYYDTTMVREIKNSYDEFQRVVTISKPDSLPGDTVLIKNYYDNIEELDGKNLYGIPQEILKKLKNLKGRPVATVSVNKVDDSRYYVVDLYSYDDEGRIEDKYKLIPGFAPQQLTFEYDLQGKKLKETFVCGEVRTIKKYVYNELGILKRIENPDQANKKLVEYSYNDLGQLKNKKLAIGTGFTNSYNYNIREWITEITAPATMGMDEKIYYDNQYNGNISQTNYKYKGNSITKTYSQSYAYDGVNRLTDVASTDTSYNSKYSYDQVGRFKTKKEGSSNNNAYAYYGLTNRLSRSKTGGSKYIYDPHGNLVIDTGKKMVVEYDWRDLPISFRFYDTIPVSVTKIDTDVKGTYTIKDTACSGCNLYEYIDSCVKDSVMQLVSSVAVLYDAAGKRVLKISGNN